MSEGHHNKRAGQSSFWISNRAYEVLRARASGNEILAYLVLAYFTDRTGQYSTAGVNAVYKYAGLSKKQAERAIKGLLNIRDKFNMPIIEDLEAGSKAKQVPRYRIELFGDSASEGIWIGGGLITGSSKDRVPPLSKIKSANYDGMIIKALMEFYRNPDEHYAGVDPEFIRWTCDIEEATGLPEEDIAVFIVSPERQAVSDRFYDRLLQGELSERKLSRIHEAVTYLIRNGYVYRAYCVLDHPDFREGQVLGCAYVEYKSKGEHGLIDLIKEEYPQFAEDLKEELGRGRYPVILRQGIEPSAVGIFRLRYRVANPKNAGVSAAWTRFKNNDAEFKEKAMEMLKRLELEHFMDEYEEDGQEAYKAYQQKAYQDTQNTSQNTSQQDANNSVWEPPF